MDKIQIILVFKKKNSNNIILKINIHLIFYNRTKKGKGILRFLTLN